MRALQRLHPLAYGLDRRICGYAIRHEKGQNDLEKDRYIDLTRDQLVPVIYDREHNADNCGDARGPHNNAFFQRDCKEGCCPIKHDCRDTILAREGECLWIILFEDGTRQINKRDPTLHNQDYKIYLWSPQSPAWPIFVKRNLRWTCLANCSLVGKIRICKQDHQHEICL